MKPQRKALFLAQAVAIALLPVSGFAADFYWSGNSGASDNIDQADNWYTAGNPSSGDNLYFNNTVSTGRFWPYSNYGSGSFFGELVSFSGAGEIRWRGDTTYIYKFENWDSPDLFRSEATLANRTGPDSDLEINPVGSGGIQVDDVIIQNGRQLKVYGGNTLNVDGTISETGTGSASLSILGSATVLLNGSNTYTGGTSVSAGELAINGSTSTGTVTVASGATLSGTGTIGGNASISGTHAVGASVGKQTISGDATYNASSAFEWELNYLASDEGVRETNYDAVDVGGTLGGDNAVFEIVLPGSTDFSDAFWSSTLMWADIFTSDGSTAISNWAGIFDSFAYFNLDGGSKSSIAAPTAAQGSFSLSGNTLTWTAIPEPTTALAGLLLGSALLHRRRSPAGACR